MSLVESNATRCPLFSGCSSADIQSVLAVVPGDGESAMHGISIVCATDIIVNRLDHLKPLPWSLADPVHVVITEDQS